MTSSYCFAKEREEKTGKKKKGKERKEKLLQPLL
jgi:hypothetical protein